MAYDLETQSFYGLVRPSAEGEDTTLIQIDISGVEAGGDPIMTSIPVTGTLVDGEIGGIFIDSDG